MSKVMGDGERGELFMLPAGYRIQRNLPEHERDYCEFEAAFMSEARRFAADELGMPFNPEAAASGNYCYASARFACYVPDPLGRETPWQCGRFNGSRALYCRHCGKPIPGWIRGLRRAVMHAGLVLKDML